MKVVRLVFSIFFVIGLGLLVGSYFTVRHTRLFLQTAVSVPGVVVENIYRASSSSRNQGPSWSYYPHIRFQTTDGHEIDFVSSTGSSPPAFVFGERTGHRSLRSAAAIQGVPQLVRIVVGGYDRAGHLGGSVYGAWNRVLRMEENQRSEERMAASEWAAHPGGDYGRRAGYGADGQWSESVSNPMSMAGSGTQRDACFS